MASEVNSDSRRSNSKEFDHFAKFVPWDDVDANAASAVSTSNTSMASADGDMIEPLPTNPSADIESINAAKIPGMLKQEDCLRPLANVSSPMRSSSHSGLPACMRDISMEQVDEAKQRSQACTCLRIAPESVHIRESLTNTSHLKLENQMTFDLAQEQRHSIRTASAPGAYPVMDGNNSMASSSLMTPRYSITAQSGTSTSSTASAKTWVPSESGPTLPIRFTDEYPDQHEKGAYAAPERAWDRRDNFGNDMESLFRQLADREHMVSVRMLNEIRDPSSNICMY